MKNDRLKFKTFILGLPIFRPEIMNGAKWPIFDQYKLMFTITKISILLEGCNKITGDYTPPPSQDLFPWMSVWNTTVFNESAI